MCVCMPFLLSSPYTCLFLSYSETFPWTQTVCLSLSLPLSRSHFLASMHFYSPSEDWRVSHFLCKPFHDPSSLLASDLLFPLVVSLVDLSLWTIICSERTVCLIKFALRASGTLYLMWLKCSRREMTPIPAVQYSSFHCCILGLLLPKWEGRCDFLYPWA